jgi:hypothetical protein
VILAGSQNDYKYEFSIPLKHNDYLGFWCDIGTCVRQRVLDPSCFPSASPPGYNFLRRQRPPVKPEFWRGFGEKALDRQDRNECLLWLSLAPLSPDLLTARFWYGSPKSRKSMDFANRGRRESWRFDVVVRVKLPTFFDLVTGSIVDFSAKFSRCRHRAVATVAVTGGRWFILAWGSDGPGSRCG